MTADRDQYAGGGAGVSSDVLVVGDGIVGLSIAVEAARRGGKVTVLGRAQQGAATWASGGLLAPSTGPLPAAVADFFYDSLAEYPAFVRQLLKFEPGLKIISGLVELVGGRAVLHSADGAVDPRRLLSALRAAAAASPRIRVDRGSGAASLVSRGGAAAVQTHDGQVFEGTHIVLAAGAWTPSIQSLPRSLPVSPLKGQMLALAGCPLAQPVLADHTYLIPRDDSTVVGSTSQETGFDSSTDDSALNELAARAREICPALHDAPVVDAWAGLRPMTPDRLPIIGADPDRSELIYACGHSRNGILLAPATALAVADILTGAAPRWNLAPFSIARFA